MTPIADIPVSCVEPINGGALAAADDGAVLLTTDARQWAHSAQVEFDIPGIARASRVIAVGVEVDAGAMGLGWLGGDGQHWVARESAASWRRREVLLPIPAGTSGGKLIFINGNLEPVASRGRIESIQIFETSPAEVPFRDGLANEQSGDLDAAIVHYKAALRIDPSHVGSIAGLGRLRFVAPEQPLLDEMKRRAAIDICEVHVAVRNPCNYRCFYCVGAGHNNEPVSAINLAAIEQVYDQIDARLIVTAFECGGGEPTVHPQIRELLEICGRFGPISMPSNNSQDPKRWLPQEIANKLEIRAALHPEGEKRLDVYLKNAANLIESGVHFTCQFIAHPTRIAKIIEYRKLFEERGIEFAPIAFIGNFNGKAYPHSYSEEEIDIIRYNFYSKKPNFAGRPDINATIAPNVNRIRNFRGISCLAGYRHLYINRHGGLQRCLYDGRLLDAPQASAQPCAVKSCGCGLFLEKLNFSQTAWFHNSFGDIAGIPHISLDWLESFARDLGFNNSEEAASQEFIAMYEALMAAYGKDEFPE